jgi:hypothetical protein
MRIKTPTATLSANGYWEGVFIDWEVVSTDNGTLFVLRTNGTQIGQFGTGLETGRKRSAFKLPSDLRVPGTTQINVLLVVSIGIGASCSGRIYEVGFIYAPRGQAIILE